MPVSVKVGGVWKTATAVYTKVGGVWKTASDMPVKVAGVWKTGNLVNKTSTVGFGVIGGGGNSQSGVGGGGGQAIVSSGFAITSGSVYTVTVGGSGSNSVWAGSVTALSGNKDGVIGRSGSGADKGNNASAYAYDGGHFLETYGGGGGSLGIGGNNAYATDTNGYDLVGAGGNGGAGRFLSVTNLSYGGGGGGGANKVFSGFSGTINVSSANGGSGGGGSSNNTGGVNTGGGGGGSISTAGSFTSYAGGSGVVIIFYGSTFANASSTTGSPSFINNGTNKIYIFTGSGSITF